MNVKRYFLASLAVFVFIFIFESVFHGNFLQDFYAQSPDLWRAKEDYQFPFMLLAQVMFPLVFTFIFTKGYENKGVGEGIRFGMLIGLLFVPTNLIFYAVQPLPFALVVLWSIGGLIEMMVAGAIAATVYRR